jgi:hypothetical protein
MKQPHSSAHFHHLGRTNKVFSRKYLQIGFKAKYLNTI